MQMPNFARVRTQLGVRLGFERGEGICPPPTGCHAVNCSIVTSHYQRVTAILRAISPNANSLKIKTPKEQLIPSSFDHNREN